MKAATSYKRALLYLDYSFGSTKAEDELFDSEKHKCHLNLAACMIELKEYRQAINECRLALSLNAGNAKAHYRRGLAHLRLGDFDEAQLDLAEAIRLTANQGEGSQVAIKDALRELEVRRNEYKLRSKQVATSSLGVG